MSISTSSNCYDPEFFHRYPVAHSLLSLFDVLPGTVFYAKDRQSRYVAGNEAMLMAKNVTEPAAYLGRTDRDFHPRMLADAYIREDEQVMTAGTPILNELWFVMDKRGKPGWYRSSKVPLCAAAEVIGIAGVRYPVKTPDAVHKSFERLAPAIRYLEKHYTEAVSIHEIGEMTGLSMTHLNRQFKQLLRMSPTRFLHTLRIEQARLLLEGGDDSICDIALKIGYWDQSHFTRYFKRLTGVSPRAYRQQYRNK
ncbi:helix-turn-helix domain-containing protein [Novipirellula sp. SH528]|uniref:PAS domain-containing protein n=1 Tax=Novipirellula sp. SH528 TaxID=3454466 RepID=UPI003FA18560